MRIHALFVLAVLCNAAGGAQAQSPIPDNRVPAFGGVNSGPVAHSPSAMGTGVGTNVGGGGNAGPNNDIISPANPPSGDGIKPPTGTSGGLTITR